MKEKADLVRGWLRKAYSDTMAVDGSLRAGALDAACFHTQQAAEKYLKAFLVYAGVSLPFTRNLSKLVELCAGVDTYFRSLLPQVEPLTPYGVALRHD
jgi:HEPN domain-containing protein